MTTAVFVFKVALQGDKSIWRRIALKGDQTLGDLHRAIYAAFDRDEEHLYSFYFPKPGAKGRARVRNAVEYSHPSVAEDPDPFGGRPVYDAEDTDLDRLGLRARQTFYYLFDFGDSWWHDITVAQVGAPVEKGKYPRVLEKHGKSPPQYPDLDEE